MSISPRARFDRSIPLAVTAGVLGLVALGAAALAGPNELRDIRIGNHAPQTHVVIEADGPFCAAIALTESPYRLSIDLPDLGGTRPTPRPLGMVAGADWSSTAPSRLLFDLKQPARVAETLVVPPADGKGFRRVIKLEPVDPQGFGQARHALAQQAAGCAPAAAAPSLPAILSSLNPPPPPPAPIMTAIPPANAAPLPARPASKALPPPAVAPKLAAAPAPSPASVSRLPKDGKWTVVIDPGHGGDDPGAISSSGEHEKNLTLAMARVLRAKMEATKRYRVYMTRDSDEFIELRERTAVAKRREAHLFISLHADTISSRLVRGLSVYTLSEKASDAESEALAAKENRSDLIVGKDHSQGNSHVSTILFNMRFGVVTNVSRQYSKLVVEEMHRSRVELLPTRPGREAGFVVLKEPEVPSVLVEMGYLSNSADAKLLRSAGHQNRLAQAIIKAADRFFACPEVVKWFAGSEDESLVAQGISCSHSSLAMEPGRSGRK
ncbi:MAG: N-acetylmuramoyl-L-alanine amidase [Alphaproteobacteria bacterium]|nr:N-acetylmuramoyl-L-alanine amidase [Alphaproteobacteria bacterium]